MDNLGEIPNVLTDTEIDEAIANKATDEEIAWLNKEKFDSGSSADNITNPPPESIWKQALRRGPLAGTLQAIPSVAQNVAESLSPWEVMPDGRVVLGGPVKAMTALANLSLFGGKTAVGQAMNPVGELAAKGIGYGAGKLGSLYSNSLKPLAIGAMENINRALSAGKELNLPASVISSGRGIEKTLSAVSAPGMDYFSKLLTKATEDMRGAISNLVNAYTKGVSTEVRAVIAKDAFAKLADSQPRAVEAAYDLLRNTVKDSGEGTIGTKKAVSYLDKTISEFESSSPSIKKEIGEVTEYRDWLNNDGNGRTMKELIDDVKNRHIAMANRTGEKATAMDRVINRANHLVDESLINEMPEQVKMLYMKAKSANEEYADTIWSAYVRESHDDLLQGRASTGIQKMFSNFKDKGVPDMVSSLNRVASRSPEGREFANAVRLQKLAEMEKASMKTVNGVDVPDLSKYIGQVNKFGDQLEPFFGKELASVLSDSKKLASIIRETKPINKVGKSVALTMASSLPGAIVGVTTRNPTAALTASLIATTVGTGLNKLLSTPIGQRLLTSGYQLAPIAESIARASIRAGLGTKMFKGEEKP